LESLKLAKSDLRIQTMELSNQYWTTGKKLLK
jgi:hypothetical protein